MNRLNVTSGSKGSIIDGNPLEPQAIMANTPPMSTILLETCAIWTVTVMFLSTEAKPSQYTGQRCVFS